MASSYSLRFRLNYQAPGDNINIWGLVLHTGVFQLLEDALAKRLAFTLSGAKTLTTANGSSDEARCAFLDITGGTGGTVTIPSVEKWYLIRNASSGDVIVTTGAGATATLGSTEFSIVVCDGSNVRPIGFNGLSFKQWVESVAFDATGVLPSQAGNAGRYIYTDGSGAYWKQPAVTELSGLDALKGEAIFLARHFA